MNVIDIGILVVLAISVIYGAYRGFLGSVLSLGGFLLSVVLALSFGPVLSDALMQNEGIHETLVGYTEFSMKSGSVNDISANEINSGNGEWEIWVDNTLARIGMPQSISGFVRKCLVDGNKFVTNAVQTGKERIQNTMAGIILRILCYLLMFFIFSLIFGVINALIRHVFKLPILKQLDWLAGCGLGLLRGCILLYAIFLLEPIITSLAPIDGLSMVLRESSLAGIFTSGGFFITAVNGIFGGMS